MDVANPLRSLSPVVDSDVLAVLHRTHAPLTGAKVAALAVRSQTQVREVLRRLERQGLVHVEQVGHAHTYVLNRDHVLVGALDAAFAASATIEHRLAELLIGWSPEPTAVVLFGSFARGDADSESDVDVLLVRPDDVDPDVESWALQRYELSRRIEDWTGNPAQIVELSASELAEAVDQDQPLVASLRADGRMVVGDIPALRRPPRASLR